MLLKVALSAAIIGYLAYDATRRGNVFANLRNQPKHWDLLAAAWACCTVGVALTFVRWWYLVRALGRAVAIGRRHPHQFLGLICSIWLRWASSAAIWSRP